MRPAKQLAVNRADDLGEPVRVRHGLQDRERFGMHVDDAAGAVGRIDMHAHRVIGFARDLVDEQLRAGQRGDGGGDVRFAGGALAGDRCSESTPRSAKASICGLNR